MDRADKAINVLRNLPKMAVATAEKTGMMPSDTLRNRALDAIDTLKKTKTDKRKVDRYIREAWRIYQRLQNLTGAEFFSDNTEHDPKRTQSTEELSSPAVRSGGLGYRNVNWDSAFMMATTKGRRENNPFWNPNSGKRDENGVLLSLEDSDYWVFKEKKDENKS